MTLNGGPLGPLESFAASVNLTDGHVPAKIQYFHRRKIFFPRLSKTPARFGLQLLSTDTLAARLGEENAFCALVTGHTQTVSYYWVIEV